MASTTLMNLSSTALYISFILYLIAILPFGLSIKSKTKSFVYAGISLTSLGFIFQIFYFISRWYVIGHAPVSNLYEFMTFFGIMLIASFLILFYMYRQSIIGLFTLPVVLLTLGFANSFSSDVTPLIPALQSEWLTIHVLTVAFSSAVLSISFVTGIIYLLKVIALNEKSIRAFFLELVMYFLVTVFGFIILTGIFSFTDYTKTITFEDTNSIQETLEYNIPIIVAPSNIITEQEGLTDVPLWLNAKKLNTILWSFLVGTVLYLIIRLVTRKKIISLLKPLTNKVNIDLMDEITYRAVVIGFPLFALGGLIFAMIWAHIAWGRFWGWDPKEVWALITFLFYATFLHLRFGKNWIGEKSAWMAIGGFGIIVFNQVFVNLVIAGLHSYA
ncbi:c-type cytochrome biogenesis protein CcsB [Psychrobacillus psychrodurans]|uniref:c-type cytochrome biogenesis protein CcsB n=1 Tax=Psychrobacillus psychrodurans TaxID=126157 RepID=UPI003CFCBE1D